MRDFIMRWYDKKLNTDTSPWFFLSKDPEAGMSQIKLGKCVVVTSGSIAKTGWVAKISRHPNVVATCIFTSSKGSIEFLKGPNQDGPNLDQCKNISYAIKNPELSAWAYPNLQK